MNPWKRLQQLFQYLGSGIKRIFAPNDDDYPTTGVQPFEGEPYSEEQNNY